MNGRWGRLFQYFLLVATAALVVVFNYQTRLHNLDRHNSESQNLLHLKQLDTQLDDEALKAVSLQLANFDSIVNTVKRIRTMTNFVGDPNDGLLGKIGPDMDRDITAFIDMMNAKTDIIESIKSRTAIIRNTINFLPSEVERVTAGSAKPVDVAINRMLGLLLAQNINPTPHNLEVLKQQLTDLEIIQVAGNGPPGLERILRHALANLQASDDLKSLMRNFMNLPTRDTLDRMFEEHSSFVLERIKTANRFRAVLLGVTLFLFAGLALALHMMRRAHAVTQRTSRQFRDAVESINEGFAFFDAHGKLSFWNRKFAEMHKDCPTVLIKGVEYRTFHDACRQRGLYPAEMLLEGETQGQAFEVQTADGLFMLASDSPMGDGGIACVRVDITATKKAEEELRKLSRAVEQSPASVMITDTDGVIAYVNPKFCDATGYTAEEIIGQKPSLVSSGERPAEDYADLWETITQGGEWRGEFHNKRKDGSLFWEMASISPVKDDTGKITHFLAVKEDITERKTTIAQLVKAKEEAELASHAKTQFLANMSHELRTPLNAIIGFSEILKTQMFGPLGSEQYIDYTENIFDSGQHLLGVINDILDVSRIETGVMTINDSDVDLCILANSCIGMVQDRADAVHLTLRTDVPSTLPHVRGDEMRIKQILLNLLTNAIKFTPDGGLVNLKIAPNDAGEMVILISDTGYGIPKDQHQKVLEPFEQVSDIYTRNHEGSGLGLYLVNSFVKLHDGTIDIDSDIDQGTTITVTLPAQRTQTA